MGCSAAQPPVQLELAPAGAAAIRDGWINFFKFSSAYLRILISPVAMDFDANQYQWCVPLETYVSPPPLLCQLQPGGTSNPSHPTTLHPGGKHLPCYRIHIMTSNHYAAVMSWALSVAASLELPFPSGPVVLFRLPACVLGVRMEVRGWRSETAALLSFFSNGLF